MSIIIQTGHSSSHSSDLMDELYLRGLSHSSKLQLKSNSFYDAIQSIYRLSNNNEKNIKTKKLIDNVIIDILLSNLEKSQWGLELNGDISSLSSWIELADNAMYVLVFDSPIYLIKQLHANNHSLEHVNDVINEWVEYNKELLKFYNSNKDKDKVLLVEGISAISSLSEFSSLLKNFNRNFELKKSWQVSKNGMKIVSKEGDNQLLLDVISNEILVNYPETIGIFNDLLQRADLKSSDSINKDKRASLYALWKSKDSLSKFECFNEEQRNLLENRLAQNKEHLVSIEQSLLQKESELKYIELELHKAKNKSNSLIAKLDSLSRIHVIELDELKKAENSKREKLLNQLFFVQEQLEKSFTGPNATELMSQKIKHSGAAEIIKKDTPYRVGSLIVKTKRPKQVILLPVELYKEYTNLKKQTGQLNLEVYKDYNEAEKVMSHLSYRLGVEVVRTFEDPKKILTLPFRAAKEVRKFRKQK